MFHSKTGGLVRGVTEQQNPFPGSRRSGTERGITHLGAFLTGQKRHRISCSPPVLWEAERWPFSHP